MNAGCGAKTCHQHQYNINNINTLQSFLFAVA
jgi:hypothetical protein